MKEKSLPSRLQESVARIQSQLDDEAGVDGDPWAGTWSDTFRSARFAHAEQGASEALAVTQFYLTRHGIPDDRFLNSLPDDLFVYC